MMLDSEVALDHQSRHFDEGEVGITLWQMNDLAVQALLYLDYKVDNIKYLGSSTSCR